MERIYKILLLGISIMLLPFSSFSQWERCNNGIRPYNQADTSYMIRELVSLGDWLVGRSSEVEKFFGRYLYYSSDYGTSWHDFPRPDVPDTALITGIFASRGALFVIYQIQKDSLLYGSDTGVKVVARVIEEQKIFRTTNRGATWELIWHRYGRNQIISNVFACDDDNIFLSGSGTVFYSSNGGKDWEERREGLSPGGFPNHISGNCDFLCATISTAGIFCTNNLGQSWVKVSPDRALGFYFRRIITKDSLILGGAYYYGIVGSTDKGRSWDHLQILHKYKYEKISPYTYFTVDATIESMLMTDNILIVGTTAPTRYVSEAMGIFVSLDTGKTWKSLRGNNIGIPRFNYDYAVYAIVEAGDYILTSMPDVGISRIRKSQFFEIATSVPTEPLIYPFQISSPYPMPATNSATFLLNLDEANFAHTDLEISIFDIYGKRVSNNANLNITPISPNTTKIEWNCESLSTGVYFLIVSYRGQTRTSKVIVMR